MGVLWKKNYPPVRGFYLEFLQPEAQRGPWAPGIPGGGPRGPEQGSTWRSAPWALGFRGLGFKGLGFEGLGFEGLGFRV